MAGALVVVIAAKVAVPVPGLEVGAVVRGVEEDGIVVQALLFQLGHQLPQILVQGGTLAQVVRVFLCRVSLQDPQVLRQDKILEALFGALRALVMVAVVLVVGLDLRDGHEEGLVSCVAVQIVQGKLIDAVRPVALEVNAVVVFIENVAVVAVRGEFQYIRRPPIAGVAPTELLGHGGDGVVDGGLLFQLSVRGQMPFADVGGFVVGILLHVAAQGLHIRGKHDIVAEAAGFRGVFAGLEQGPAGTADRLGGEGVVKADTFGGQGVQVGGDVQGLAVAAAGVPALLVAEIKNQIISHVRFPPCWVGPCSL